MASLSDWRFEYLLEPEPLRVQSEAESTRIDIAARISGRLAKIAVSRSRNVVAGATLLVIDNPELVAELRQTEAEKTVAYAKLQRIRVGTRPEILPSAKPEAIARRLTHPDAVASVPGCQTGNLA